MKKKREIKEEKEREKEKAELKKRLTTPGGLSRKLQGSTRNASHCSTQWCAHQVFFSPQCSPSVVQQSSKPVANHPPNNFTFFNSPSLIKYWKSCAGKMSPLYACSSAVRSSAVVAPGGPWRNCRKPRANLQPWRRDPSSASPLI